MTAEEKRIKRACEALVHCAACRNSIETRYAIGMPDVCPDGWTADNLPKIVRIDTGQIALCKQCPDMPHCPSVKICKSCGGKSAPRVVAPCPK